MKIASPNAEPAANLSEFQKIVTVPLTEFETAVEERSGGRIDVEIFFAGQLGKMETYPQLVRMGAVQAGISTDAQVSPYFEDINVLSTPYIFGSTDIAFSVFDDGFGEWLNDRMAEESNMRVIAWMQNGFRNFTANTPLNSAADLKGLKIRVQPSEIYMQMVQSLGASPTPIPFSDLYTSLQTGVVDGQENPYVAIRTAKLEEVQKYIIEDKHTYGVLVLVANEDWLESLPEDLRQIVREEALAMAKRERQRAIDSDVADRAYLESKGMTVKELTTAELQAFKDLTQPDALKLVGQTVDQEVIDALFAAVAEAEKTHAN
ncbi:MAG: hypothetical protein CML23_26850 [Rhizobiaceae bacterium]|nr:hypothetical protein [Rhizobiaceae bacterium]